MFRCHLPKCFMPNLSKRVTAQKTLIASGGRKQGRRLSFLKSKSLLCEHKKAPWKAPRFILTKTQPVSGKLPFVIIRKLRWVYVHIIVSIDLLNNLPLYFIHGLLGGRRKEKILFFIFIF